MMLELESHLPKDLPYPDNIPCLAEFNDFPETTHADVLALFDKAIEKCKQ